MEYLTNLWEEYHQPIITFALALLILVGFYILARIARAIIRKLLNKTDIDNRFVKAVGLDDDFPVEGILSGTVFWIVLTYGVLTFFDKLNLETVAQPISNFLNEIFVYLPRLGAAAGLLILAWVLASLVRIGIEKLAGLTKVDERLNSLDEENGEEMTVGNSLATAGYWMVFLLFIPAILGALEMESLVAPLQEMFSKIFTYLPNLLSAVLIYIVGSFVARIIRQILSSLLAASGADNLSAKVGMEQKVSHLVGTLAYTFILLLVIVQSLDALKVEAISAPAKSMVDMIFAAAPGIVSAVLVLAISYYIGKLLASIVSDLLSSAGFNSVTEKLGIKAGMQRTPSEYVGSLVLLGVILFAILGATELLGFTPLSDIVSSLITFAIQVVLGAVILGLGIMIANKVRALIVEAGISSSAASLARISILVLSTAMALRQIGLADDIINMAFAIMLGSLGIAAAIAIGLGSKDIAAREVENLIGQIKK